MQNAKCTYPTGARGSSLHPAFLRFAFCILNVVTACLIAAFAVTMSAQSSPPPLSRAERTRFEETSRYEEVRDFLSALAAQTPRARLEFFGRSEEGRDLPLVVIGDPPAASPEAARRSSRPVVLVLANIHAGEVEGKEALLHLARRLTLGDLQRHRRDAVWLFAPIYNADGNEKISFENRSEQNGPIGGVGTRENGRGLDLNRDFVKLDSAEGRALAALLTRWDPHVVVDLHTTNGSYHGYHLTYTPSLNPNTDPRILGFARERLLPAVRAAMAARHQFRTYYYGNFATAESLGTEQTQFGAAERGTPVWRTFDHRPRFGTNYVGLRNRIAILSEAYSSLDFAGRVQATEAFVEEIMRFVAANGDAVRTVVSNADNEWQRRGAGSDAAIASRLSALPAQVNILVGAVGTAKNPRSGRMMTTMTESVARPTRMTDYGLFTASTSRRVPRSYVIAASQSGLHQTVARKLREHGVRVESLATPARMTAETFIVDTVRRSDRVFQGHREVSVTGRFERRDVELPARPMRVSADQPLGRLVVYLLEPESDDSLATWTLLDVALAPGAVHPVMKVF